MARNLELKLKLQTSKKGGSTCAEYLQHMQNIADRLRSIGSDVLDQELVLYTLQGLEQDFESFVTAISLRPGSVTMSELRNLLFSHEAWQQAHLASLSTSMANLTIQSSSTPVSGSHITPHIALYVGSRPNYNPNYVNFPNSRRGRGNSRGNYRGRGRASSSPFENIQCQICFKWGHSTIKCYHRFNLTYTTDPPPSSSSSSHPTPPPATPAPQALLAEPYSSPSPDWFLDSGASTHITNDLNNLSSHVVYVGSDKVHISHIGSSLLHTSG